jgi:hypothetical protein
MAASALVFVRSTASMAASAFVFVRSRHLVEQLLHAAQHGRRARDQRESVRHPVPRPRDSGDDVRRTG